MLEELSRHYQSPNCGNQKTNVRSRIIILQTQLNNLIELQAQCSTRAKPDIKVPAEGEVVNVTSRETITSILPSKAISPFFLCSSSHSHHLPSHSRYQHSPSCPRHNRHHHHHLSGLHRYLRPSCSRHDRHHTTRVIVLTYDQQRPLIPSLKMAAPGLPMGYASQTGMPLAIEGLIQLLSSLTGPRTPGKAHSILVYFARGNNKGGDEAKLQKLDVST
jgi:hypothetical protein